MKLPLLFSLLACTASAAMKPGSVTFYKDVLPILQKNCQECHRAGEAAPMALTTYEEVRPWVKAIKVSVLARKMPPWFADPAYGKFHNARQLKPDEIEIISAWADKGAPPGDKCEGPPMWQWT